MNIADRKDLSAARRVVSGLEERLEKIDRNVEIEDLASRMDLSSASLVVSGLESTLEKMDRNVNSRMLAEILLLDLPKI